MTPILPDNGQPADGTAPAAASDAISTLETLDRRSFLLQAMALTGGLTACTAATAASAPAAARLHSMTAKQIASFLTGKSDLPEGLVNRAYAALVAEHADFDRQLNTLADQIHTAGLADVEAFRKSSLAADPARMSTVIAFVGALYTGKVGQGYQGHFVAYQESLMYRPTADITAIPSYSHFEPGYWSRKPE